jgi:histone deacetylase 1/2
VARCWANETATLLGRTLDENIPEHEFYYEYYSDASYQLKVQQKNPIENLNSCSYLQDIKTCILNNLSQLEVAPSVQMHELPPEAFIPELDDSALNEDELSRNIIKNMAVNEMESRDRE